VIAKVRFILTVSKHAHLHLEIPWRLDFLSLTIKTISLLLSSLLPLEEIGTIKTWGQPLSQPLVSKSTFLSQALVVHAYNPSYSGGRDQEEQGSKLAQANSL
jgi:hypothetical protein